MGFDVDGARRVVGRILDDKLEVWRDSAWRRAAARTPGRVRRVGAGAHAVCVGTGATGRPTSPVADGADGLVALGPSAMACLAHDQDITVDIESDY